MRKFIISLCVMAPVTGFSTAALATSLSEAVQKTLMTNPDMAIVIGDKNIAKADAREAWGAFLPSLDLSGAAGGQWTDSPSTRSAAAASGGDPSPDLFQYQATATLRQLLFDGFGAAYEYDRRQSLTTAASNRIQDRAEGLALDATEAYLEVLRRNRLVMIAEQNSGIHGDYREMVRKRSEGGGGTVADLRQGEARLGTAQTTLATLRGNLADAEASYQRLIGEMPDNLARPDFDFGSLPADVNSAVAQTLKTSPAILAARAEMESAEAGAKGAYAPYMPRFDLELSGSKGEDLDGIQGDNDRASALVVARWNLFRGGADEARKDAAVSRKMRAQDVIARTERIETEQTRFAWNAMASARERVLTLRGVTDSNERVRDAYRKQFELGQRSLLDLLDSENELFLSRSELVTAEYTALFGAYRLMSAMGTLTGNLGVKVPDELAMSRTGNE